MKILTLLFIVLMFGPATGQTINNPKALGDKAFTNKDYYEAAHYYKLAAEGLKLVKMTQIPYQRSVKTGKKVTGEDKGYISFMLAESYRLHENYTEAEGWYYNVLNDNYEPKYPLARLWYGVCLRANGKFDESVKQLQQFLMAYKGDSQHIEIAKKEIATCNFAKEQLRYPILIQAARMKGTWDSDGSDYALVKRDQNYWFTSSRLIKDDKKHLNRIYVARGGTNPAIINFKNDGHIKGLEYGTPVFPNNGTHMFFTRWYKQGSKAIHEIYMSRLQNGEWSTPVKLNSNVNMAGYKAIQPFVTMDGKRMYYVSNKPGGLGGDDIWVSELDNNGNPTNSTNLGKNINTAYDEQAPYYDSLENTLIYSSKGFIGLGGFDFFESKFSDNQWSVAKNMGYPLNSIKDDLYYHPDGANSNRFYISSDRESDCCLDLFEVTDKRHLLTGLIVDCITRKALPGVKVSFVDSLSKQTLKMITLGQNGKYVFKVDNDRPYNLVVEKSGYFTKIIHVSKSGRLVNDTLYNSEICMQGFDMNKPIALKNILFDYGKTSLRSESMEVLNELVEIMHDNPNIKIELSAHTDGIGSDAYNNKLSQERAEACVAYIIAKGIDKERIFARGYGKTKPIAPNTLPDGKDNPDGRQLNRRTEFTVLKVE